jgi:hypothetical protein
MALHGRLPGIDTNAIAPMFKLVENSDQMGKFVCGCHVGSIGMAGSGAELNPIGSCIEQLLDALYGSRSIAEVTTVGERISAEVHDPDYARPVG